MLNDYAPLQPITMDNKNDLFTGQYNGQKVFIKKYILREGREKEDQQKIDSEIICYQNIHSIMMPRLIEANRDEKYLILEFVDYEDVDINEKTLDEALQLHEKLRDIEADGLPCVNFPYYTGNLFDRLKVLDKDFSIIENREMIESLFLDNEELIESQALAFSHGDMHFYNIKRFKGELTLVDFENAKQDNSYYDLATMYRVIYHTPYRNYFYQKLIELPGFNVKLFKLMLVRRCIGVLFYLRNRQSDKDFKQTIDILSSVQIS